jgi:hypothetical protein
VIDIGLSSNDIAGFDARALYRVSHRNGKTNDYLCSAGWDFSVDGAEVGAGLPGSVPLTPVLLEVVPTPLPVPSPLPMPAPAAEVELPMPVLVVWVVGPASCLESQPRPQIPTEIRAAATNPAFFMCMAGIMAESAVVGNPGRRDLRKFELKNAMAGN